MRLTADERKYEETKQSVYSVKFRIKNLAKKMNSKMFPGSLNAWIPSHIFLGKSNNHKIGFELEQKSAKTFSNCTILENSSGSLLKIPSKNLYQ